MSDISVRVQSSISDSLFKGQVNRWSSRPLETDNSELAKFSSFKGRGYALLNILHTLVREPYRVFKNFLIIAERVYKFVRTFFESLFKEANVSWNDTGKRGKELLSSIGALFVRPLTFILDLLKLGAGVIVPAAAIKANKTDEETEQEELEEFNEENQPLEQDKNAPPENVETAD